MKYKILKKLLTPFLLIFFIINTSYAEVPFTWMYGVYLVTYLSHHSPLHGLEWSEQGIVEDLYHSKNIHHATIKLSKELFYLQKDGVSFRPTVLQSKPASYWKPKDIGALIMAITTYRENLEDNTFLATLADIVQSQRVLMHKKREEIDILMMQKKEIVQDLANQNRKLSTRIGQIESKKSSTLMQLDADIQEINQLHKDKSYLIGTREILEKAINKLKYDRKLLTRALDHEITHLTYYFLDSIKESMKKDMLYVLHTPEYILLTLLWKIANPRENALPEQDFIDYFDQLGEKIDQNALQQWIVQRPYNKNDCIQFYSVESSSYSATKERYEQNILAKIGHSVWYSLTPPIFPGAGASYICLDGTQTDITSECMETSFRIFLNIVLCNMMTSIFDIERLIMTSQNDTDDIPLKLYAPFTDFYEKNKCITNVRAAQLYNAWARMLQRLLGVIYMKPYHCAQRARFYEVKSSFPNMLHVCNHLLFGNNPVVNQLPRAKQLDLICAKLSRTAFCLSWNTLDQTITDDILESLNYVSLKFMVNDTYSFDWHLKEGHSVIPRIIYH